MTTCKAKYDRNSLLARFFVDGVEVEREVWQRACRVEQLEQRKALPLQNGKRFVPPAHIPAPDQGWQRENGGKGRYISQLQEKPGPAGSDPSAYCQSQREIFEKCKRKGLHVERTR